MGCIVSASEARASTTPLSMSTTTLITEVTAQIAELRRLSPEEADLFSQDLVSAGNDLRELLMLRESLDDILS